MIGFTSGVFDLFHIGHLNILLSAKKHCDYLIVGVTTDEEAYRIKNLKPIIPFKERIQIVSALKCVDKAVPENDADKFVSWNKYKFDVIFKGDDWKGTPKWIEYEKRFSKVGVKVMFFPYTKGSSSTILREVLDNFLQ